MSIPNRTSVFSLLNCLRPFGLLADHINLGGRPSVNSDLDTSRHEVSPPELHYQLNLAQFSTSNHFPAGFVMCAENQCTSCVRCCIAFKCQTGHKPCHVFYSKKIISIFQKL